MRGVHHTRQRGQLQPGQALVELAISVTVLVMLLAAALDLGLAFKTYQTLVNATAEASRYLQVSPHANCLEMTCPNGDPIAGANAEARRRFQTEQGGELGGMSTADLDADGVLDDESLVRQWVQIDPADNRQVTPSSNTFAVGSTFDPTLADPECKLRKANPQSTNPAVVRCYIVIRSQIIYRPFVLQPILGNSMTIREISVYEVK